MGVTLFRLDAGEQVTSVFPIIEDDANDETAIDPSSGDDTAGQAGSGEGEGGNG